MAARFPPAPVPAKRKAGGSVGGGHGANGTANSDGGDGFEVRFLGAHLTIFGFLSVPVQILFASADSVD